MIAHDRSENNRSVCCQSTTPKGYEQAIGYLKKIRALMDGQDRTGEWAFYMEGLRSTHARKKKFIGMLDVMEGKQVRKSI